MTKIPYNSERILDKGSWSVKISLICFTENGLETERKLARIYQTAGHQTALYALGTHVTGAAKDGTKEPSVTLVGDGLGAWTGEQFAKSDALIFVGACGIAVRAISPYVEDKRTDPAVLVVDERGSFIIPILSGHIGGANELASLAAERTKATAVITTATDINSKFSVDMFAKNHGLLISDMQAAKAVSADILAGEPVGLFSDFAISGRIPKELLSNTMCRHNIWITISKKGKRAEMDLRMLRLIPRCVSIGLGCRRGTPVEKLKEVLAEAMEKNHLDEKSVCALSSIDIKKEEAGLVGLAQSMKAPFLTYPKEELEAVPGAFSDSQVVRQTVGIGNVCERAAMAACLEVSRNSHLLFSKWARDGVTVAAAYFVPELFAERSAPAGEPL